MAGKRVAVAMSGGVDSSVSAALLLEAGYEVRGVYLRLWSQDGSFEGKPPLARDRAANDSEDAGAVCRFLGIPFDVLDAEDEFLESVVRYFCDEYAAGRTPNPCIACNEHIKFGLLLDRVQSMGVDYLATGHYARVAESGRQCRLFKAVDLFCDQSYFLYMLGQRELGRVLFPVGGCSKGQVRRMAADLGLPVAGRKESQDICFIPDGRLAEFIAARVPCEPGDIVDSDGRVLGRHRGIALYTVGQRTGLGVAAGSRVYVRSIDVERNRVVVGGEEDLFVSTLRAGKVRFVSDRPESPTAVTARIRYNSPEAQAMLFPEGDDVRIEFQVAQRAVAPGQSVVFYRGDEVVGGGVIESP